MIGRTSRILAIIGIISLVLFFIILIGGHLAFVDSSGEVGEFVTWLFKYAFMAFMMLYACYYLWIFSNKTIKGMVELNELEFQIGLKYLRGFIINMILALLVFVIVSLIEVYFL